MTTQITRSGATGDIQIRSDVPWIMVGASGAIYLKNWPGAVRTDVWGGVEVVVPLFYEPWKDPDTEARSLPLQEVSVAVVPDRTVSSHAQKAVEAVMELFHAVGVSVESFQSHRIGVSAASEVSVGVEYHQPVTVDVNVEEMI